MEDVIMIPATKNQNWLSNIFNEMFPDDDFMPVRTRHISSPAVNIIENEKDFRIEVAAPGMSKEDLHVDVNEQDELVISFEKHTENKSEGNEKVNQGTYLRREFSYSSFRQSFALPENIEKTQIDAHMENGVLTIELPKKEEKKEVPTSRRIEIR